MVDQNGVIEASIQPYSLKEFKYEYRDGIQFTEAVLKEAGADIIDFSDNMCWEDVCHVLTPRGYCVMFDDDHFTTLAARNWLNIVDYLTIF